MINVAFVGAGRMANHHVGYLKNIPDVKLYGIYDIDPQAAKIFMDKYGCERNYASLAELAADSAVDGVLVCNFSDQHYQTLIELMDAGKKNIFCEKALVRQLTDGEDLLRREKASGARIMVGHHRRYQAGYERLREIILAGELGTIRMAKVAYCQPAYGREWGNFFADFERSGGVTLDMMSHLFDQLNWYFGEPATVTGNSLMLDRSQPKPMDYVSATITYKNGVICNIDGSFQRYGVGYDKIEVYGDNACAIYDQGDKLHIYRRGEHTELSLANADPYAEQMKAFLSMIKEGNAPRNGLSAGFDSARVALTLIDAIQKHQIVNF